MDQETQPKSPLEDAVRVQADASRKLAAETRLRLDSADLDLSSALNQLLENRVGTFKTDAAEVTSSDGTVKVGPFAVVVNKGEVRGPVIPIDGVAAVVDAYEELTLENLRAAYEHARLVKALTKTSVVDGTAADPTAVAMTLVVVFARRSSLSLDEISDEMSKLNLALPAHSWPDMVAVDGKGIVNYGTRVPGDDKLDGFILPVAGHAPKGLTAPLYIYKTIRAAGAHTFNKVASFIVGRVAIFAPGTVLGKYDTELEELADNCIVTDAHQFNLSGELRRLSEVEQVNDLLPTDIYGIVAGKKELGSIQFRRWQDGGFLTVRGQFTIEPFLPFLRMQVPSIPPKDFQLIRRSSIQVSMVLPITENDFLRTLQLFQARTSGIKIRKDIRKLLIQKYAEEGTSSPFYGRLMLGIFKVRDIALSQSERQQFDKLFDATFSALVAVRDAAEAIRSTWETHRDKVAAREIVVEQGRQIQITATIDKQLKRESETFVTGAVRTLKSCVQALTNHLNTDIGFLFKKDNAFKAGLEALSQTDPVLAAYIADARTWSGPLIHIRNEEIEHGLGADFRVAYDVEEKVTAREPVIRGEPLSTFTTRILDRLSCFVEEVIVHLLQKRLPSGIALTEIAPGARTPAAPERFRITTSVGGLPPWRLTPHQRRFEDC
jgi:hypothetical protein